MSWQLLSRVNESLGRRGLGRAGQQRAEDNVVRNVRDGSSELRNQASLRSPCLGSRIGCRHKNLCPSDGIRLVI